MKREEGNKEQREREIWKKKIQPIIDAYDIKGITYQHIPSESNPGETLKMDRYTQALCNGRPFDSFNKALLYLRNGKKDPNFDYKNFFIEVMSHFVEQRTLPYFLEYIGEDLEKEGLKEGKDKKELLPCEVGTKWDDVKITLISDEAVEIETPQGKERFSYHELELSDKRKGDQPKKLWHILKTFAKLQGFVSLEKADDKAKKEVFTYAPKLDKHLQLLFGITKSIYTSHYKRRKGQDNKMGYETRIKFSDRTVVVAERIISKEDANKQEIKEIFEEHASINPIME